MCLSACLSGQRSQDAKGTCFDVREVSCCVVVHSLFRVQNPEMFVRQINQRLQHVKAELLFPYLSFCGL